MQKYPNSTHPQIIPPSMDIKVSTESGEKQSPGKESSAGKMIKQSVTKEDGRRLIFYSFAKTATAAAEEKKDV